MEDERALTFLPAVIPPAPSGPAPNHVSVTTGRYEVADLVGESADEWDALLAYSGAAKQVLAAADFLTVLRAPGSERRDRLLRVLTTPESWSRWGDFESARDDVVSLGDDTGIASDVRRGYSDDIAFVKVMSGVKQRLRVQRIDRADLVIEVHRAGSGDDWLADRFHFDVDLTMGID